jgi:hypothetical protein
MAAGQDYAFGVPELELHAVVQSDASVKLIYDITFQNMAGAHPIDIVDIGVPHKNYSLNNVRASIGGQNLSNIRPSEFVKPGFEVHLGPATIMPGQTGTLHVEFVMPDMVYQDTTRDDYASFRVTPTWFGSQYIRGLTNIQVAVHLPKGIGRDEILHQGQKFSNVVETGDGFSAVWQIQGQRLDGPHMVAISFPKRDLARVVHITRWQLLVRWFSESQGARVFASILVFILGAVVYFRFTGGTGFSLFVVLVIGCGIWFFIKPAAHLLALPVLATLAGANEYFLHKRKSKYLPAIAEVEGGGIKRGLTAPEAAVLLELPIERVLGLVIFGLLKKGILRQIDTDPLIVELHEGFLQDASASGQKDLAKHYRKAARKLGTVVHGYEISFLFLLEKNAGKPVAGINFAAPIKVLIGGTAAKMKAFDLSDTKDYYRSIVRRAVNQAKNVGDIKQIDKHFQWIMIDDDFSSVFDTWNYTPSWHRPIGHVGGWSGPPIAAPPAAGTTTGSTSLGDVGASFAGWTENTMGAFASSISPGSLNLAEAKTGFMDLSGIDRATGAFFEALAESGGSGGGGGGGCACAGCACACACAGGGR